MIITYNNLPFISYLFYEFKKMAQLVPFFFAVQDPEPVFNKETRHLPPGNSADE